MTVETTHSDAHLLELMAIVQESLPEHTSKAVLRRANEKTKTEGRRYLEGAVERIRERKAWERAEVVKAEEAKERRR